MNLKAIIVGCFFAFLSGGCEASIVAIVERQMNEGIEVSWLGVALCAFVGMLGFVIGVTIIAWNTASPEPRHEVAEDSNDEIREV